MNEIFEFCPKSEEKNENKDSLIMIYNNYDKNKNLEKRRI